MRTHDTQCHGLQCSRGGERHDRFDADHLPRVKNLTCKLYFTNLIILLIILQQENKTGTGQNKAIVMTV